MTNLEKELRSQEVKEDFWEVKKLKKIFGKLRS